MSNTHIFIKNADELSKQFTLTYVTKKKRDILLGGYFPKAHLSIPVHSRLTKNLNGILSTCKCKTRFSVIKSIILWKQKHFMSGNKNFKASNKNLFNSKRLSTYLKSRKLLQQL